MGIFARHAHKDKLAYNTNHDTLMAMSPANRAKMITYFIAANTRVKLDPADRVAFSKEIETIQQKADVFGLFGITAGILTSLALRKPVPVTMIAAVCGGYFPRFLYSNHAETKFVFESALVQNLTLKYQFSLFDFHNSKKEAQIGQLAAEILSENSSMLNTYTA